MDLTPRKEGRNNNWRHLIFVDKDKREREMNHLPRVLVVSAAILLIASYVSDDHAATRSDDLSATTSYGSTDGSAKWVRTADGEWEEVQVTQQGFFQRLLGIFKRNH